jgi:hypothetical protein
MFHTAYSVSSTALTVYGVSSVEPLVLCDHQYRFPLRYQAFGVLRHKGLTVEDFDDGYIIVAETSCICI